MLNFAFGNLLSRSFRSFLAVMGLAIAIGGMVALFSIAQGIDYVVTRTFAQIPGLAVQQRGAPVPLFSTLPASWAKEIARLPGVDVVDSEIVQRLNVLDGKPLIAPPRFVVGLDLNVRPRLLRDVYRENLKSGRFFEASDVGTNRCIISRQIADETGRKTGDILHLNDYAAEIIGIYDTGSALLDVNILLDITAVREFMRIDPDTVSFFYVETAPTADQRVLKKEIEQIFENRSVNSAKDLAALNSWGRVAGLLFSQLESKSGLAARDTGRTEREANRPAGPVVSESAPVNSEPAAASGEVPSMSAVEARLAEEWSQRFADFTGDLKLFLMLITTMAVMIAVLSIVNTMTMSVSECMIEFGILRANGWSKSHIMQLMTLESGLLGIAGGVLGTLLGLAATYVVNSLYPDRLQLHASPGLLIFAVVASAVLGVVGGLYPSWLAASRSPMDAIRRG